MTRILSNIKKTQGDAVAARDILCELQVETFGSMTRREKTEFILDQVQLCMDTGDWTQAGILSRKISTRYFNRKPKKTPEQLEKEKKEREEKEKNRSADEPPPEPEDDVTDLKLRYYEQQIKLAKHDSKYLEACKHYRQVIDTESVEENKAQLKAVSRHFHLALTAQLIILNHRPCNAPSIMSFSPRMITNSLTFSTVRKLIHVLPTWNLHTNPNSYGFLPSPNLCAGPWYRSNLRHICALRTYSPPMLAAQGRKETRRPTHGGMTCASG